MKMLTRVALLFVNLVLLGTGSASAGQGDAEGSKDHPLFSRMPGYVIQRYEEREFDSHEFRDAKLNALAVEGHVFEIRYALTSGAAQPSRIQVLRNYENAMKRIGGTVLKSDYDGNSFMKVAKDGKEIWAHVSAYITDEFTLFVVEKAAMTQAVVGNAQVFSDAIRTTGHAAVYGIYFDTGKSELKPESDAALAEIAKLLKQDASLKVHVVGHTDDVGALDSNMKLSQDRAAAVIASLSGKRGIAAARLKAYGVGPLAPVASNDSEDGRAKNRRVELVKR